MLEVDDVSLAYGDTPVAQGLSLALARGEIGCLLGASGCGKTTLLRAIGGFEPVRSGRILIDGRQVSDALGQVPPQQRGIGMVFQDHALFPHLDVAGNVGFGLKGLAPGARRERVQRMLALVGLQGLDRRWPHELSGGQQQRVALARALAPRPALLLLDEPFSNLDVGLRESLAREVRAILRQEGATAVLVTHDQREAFAIADRVGVMASGRLWQWAGALDVYRRPASREVALFVGEGTLLRASPDGSGGWRTALGVAPPDAVVLDGPQGPEVLLRPEAVQIRADGPGRARVRDRVYRGSGFLYTLELDGAQDVLALGAADRPHELGEQVGVALAVRARDLSRPAHPAGR